MAHDTDSEDEARATVDVTVDPDTMLEVRNELRDHLIRHYHLLKISARAHRKVGALEECRVFEIQAGRTLLMIWGLQNPMEGLTRFSKNRKARKDSPLLPD
ncbi:MAG: hypothetical protein ACRDGS_14360 [Chloroflexota bacterium]